MLPRVRKHFVKANVEVSGDFLADEIRATPGAAKGISAQAAWALLRTWTNGWVTASRVGGNRALCVFGCGDDSKTVNDSLQHYLVCPTLWTCVAAALAPLVGELMSFCFHSVLALSSRPLEPITMEKRQNLICAITVAVDVFNRRRHSMQSLDEIAKASIQRFLISKTITFRHVKFTISCTISSRSSTTLGAALGIPSNALCPNMSPASDPNLSDSESPEPPTPRVPLAWDACSVYHLFDGTESDFLGSKKLLPRNVTSDNVTHNNVTDSEEDPIETVRGARPLWEKSPLSLPAHGMASPLLGSETHDLRAFCEPECGELPMGSHHPHCSQFFLLDSQFSFLESNTAAD
jgi:hypothetical protein